MRELLGDWAQCVIVGILYAAVLNALAWGLDEPLPRYAYWLAVIIGINLVVCLQAAERAR
jgi:hypothetical protein